MAESNVQIRIQLDGSKAVLDGLASIGNAAQSTQRALLQLGGALAAAAGLGSLAQAAISTAKLGGEMATLAARTGIATQSLILLRQAFKDADLGAERVGTTINKLQQSIADAVQNGGSMATAFDDIGMSATDLYQLAPEEQFQRVSAAIGGLPDQLRRTAAATAIFGRSGAELLPLFGEGGAMDNAQRVLGSMPQTMARNASILDDISDAFDRLPNKATQLFVGIYDQIAPTVKAILDAFESIDLTTIGKKIGGYVNVGIDAWKSGQFAEFVGLSIGAAFEVGMKKGREWMDWLFSAPAANAIGNFTVTLVSEVGKAFIDINVFFRGVWHGMMIYAGNAFVEMLKAAVSFFATELQNALNAALTVARLLYPTIGKLIPPANIPKPTSNQVDFDTALSAGMVKAEGEAVLLKFAIDKLVGSYRTFFGMDANASAPESNLSKLDELLLKINANLNKRELQDWLDELDKALAIEEQGDRTILPTMNMKNELLKLELFYSSELANITERRGQIESNWLKTNATKYAEKKKLLQDELQLLLDQEIELQNLMAMASPEERPGIAKQIQAVQTRQGGVENQMVGMGPDPTSYTQQFALQFKTLKDEAKITAQSIAQTFADVFNAAISSISNGITSVIMGTKSWGQALMEIGTSILTSIVGAIVQMGVRWIATQILMATVGKSIMAAAVAASAPIAAAQSAVWATPATLSTISSFGAAATAAPGFIAASQGIVMAQSMMAFKTGGYTGDGDPNDVAGIVHRGEYVVPAEAVATVGLDTLESMFSGVPSSGPSVIAGPMSAPSPIVMNMGVFDDPRRLSDWAKSNDGRTVLVDIMRQHAHEFRA